MNADDIKRLGDLNMKAEEKYLLYYLSYKNHNISRALQKLKAKELIQKDMTCGYKLTIKGLSALKPYLDENTTTEDEQKELQEETRIENLAKEMQKHYPAGIKPGTSSQWRGSISTIVSCLQRLIDFKGFTFTDEEAIKAVDDYVGSFTDDTRYMCLLKYFIIKADYDEFKNPVIRSIMQEYIENARTGETINNMNNWTKIIR